MGGWRWRPPRPPAVRPARSPRTPSTPRPPPRVRPHGRFRKTGTTYHNTSALRFESGVQRVSGRASQSDNPTEPHHRIGERCVSGEPLRVRGGRQSPEGVPEDKASLGAGRRLDLPPAVPHALLVLPRRRLQLPLLLRQALALQPTSLIAKSGEGYGSAVIPARSPDARSPNWTTRRLAAQGARMQTTPRNCRGMYQSCHSARQCTSLPPRRRCSEC